MKRAEFQLSLKDAFAIITLLCALLAGLGACFDLAREAKRRSECLPGLTGGHPYWSTPEGQRMLAAYKKWRDMSDTERARSERAVRLRVYVGQLSYNLTAFFIVAWLAVRLVVYLMLQWWQPSKQ